MKCPSCGTETEHFSTGETLVGYPIFIDKHGEHHHNDNCLKRRYSCSTCSKRWAESLIRTCPLCDWTGKTNCFCHLGEKVKTWTDKKEEAE